ncbi:hypothetical protein D3C73_1363900 [compost metagenome]
MFGYRDDGIQEVLQVLPEIFFRYLAISFKQRGQMLQPFRFPTRHRQGAVLIDQMYEFQGIDATNFSLLEKEGG